MRKSGFVVKKKTVPSVFYKQNIMEKTYTAPPGNLRLCENGDKIRLYIGNTYRDLSITFARTFSGKIKEAADRLAKKQKQDADEKL